MTRIFPLILVLGAAGCITPEKVMSVAERDAYLKSAYDLGYQDGLKARSDPGCIRLCPSGNCTQVIVTPARKP